MADEPRTSTPPSGSSTGPGGGEERQLVLCPYCGRTQFNTERCEACGGLFEPLSRMATQIAMGPWFIRDKAQPFKPGCSYETLKRMIQRGAIHANTVIRGPTTRQFWSIARNVPGVAHLVGFCHRCQEEVDPTDAFCPECSEPFTEPRERNELGLRFPTHESARRAQRELNRRLRREAGEEVQPPSPSGDSTLTGQEVGLLEASMDEAMQYLATAEQADATGYGMNLEDMGKEMNEEMDEQPVVARPPGDSSKARAAEILGKREDAGQPSPGETLAALSEPGREAAATPRERRQRHPFVEFVLLILAFIGLVALGALLTYPLWREQVTIWLRDAGWLAVTVNVLLPTTI